MASNGSQEAFAPASVLEAMATMRGAASTKKQQAHEYLDKFQKSPTAWTTTITILQSEAEPDVKLFAATTLKGKITYDLTTQIPASEHAALRTQLLALLKLYAPGPKPIRVQLCVCLAMLAIQMLDWKDVLPVVASSLGNDTGSHAVILDFLKVLPEEVNEGRKVTLTEEELEQRASELLEGNGQQVVQLLINYAHSSPAAARNPQLMECITSWLKEVPISAVVNSPLLNVIFNALDEDESFTEASECVYSLVRETGPEIDDNIDVIRVLFPRIVALRPKIERFVKDEDVESLKSLTFMFSNIGLTWCVAIARDPRQFRPLVECVLECAARDEDREAIEHTFDFWDELRMYLTIENYIEARMEYVDVYSALVDVLLKRLEYPHPESGNENDLFDGDREQEEKFREFRHHMGDVLKDCCEVMGTTECLTKVLDAINGWTSKYGSQANGTSVPHWQGLEAAVFAMRAMGRMVDKDENIVLPQLMPMLVQIPPHEKLRFATIMVLARYTEWTAAHPEFLAAQFNYIVSSFETDSKEILRAAAWSMKFFCADCKHLLGEQVLQLQQFYDQVLDKLPESSQEEITEGVANVVGVQPKDAIYRLLKLYVDPLMMRLMKKAEAATTEPTKLAVADHLQLVTRFVESVVILPPVEAGEQDPAVKYWEEVFPVLTKILDNFLDFPPICERICRCWRYMVISHRGAMTPILPEMANKLANGFATSRQGCFLWVTGAILREFSEDREHVDQNITDSIYQFFEAQTTNVLRCLSDIPPKELPDVTEDFFRLLTDALLYYPIRLIPSPVFNSIFQAAVSVLGLEQREPLSATLHYLRDLLAWGCGNPPSGSQGLDNQVLSQLQDLIKSLLSNEGESLVKRIMAGMMITFPRDCFADGSGVLLSMFQILPQQTTAWVQHTVSLLPPGTITQAEGDRLIVKIKEKLNTGDSGELRQIRAILQDFTNTYRRRYVAPREGLGQLEAARFHFAG